MEFKELKLKSKDDLEELLGKTREELRELRFKVSIGTLKKVSELKVKKHGIARILTILNTK